ncbi:MAG: alcohol dehydrogenase catalytic domain-containing protein [Chloroflexota bacterium]
MRALVLDRTLRFVEDFPEPEVIEGEALLHVRLAGICRTDVELTRGYKGGFSGVLGHEFVGEVVACAEAGWVGQRVCGEINIGCGRCSLCRDGLISHCSGRTVVGILGRHGVFAEYVALPTRNLHSVPGSVPDDDAVFIEPLAAAFEILEQINVEPDSRVFVLGDGKLGNLCAQVLKNAGADVLVLGKHRSKLALMESCGIGTALLDEALPGCADIVIEATGTVGGFNVAVERLRPRGTLVLKSTVAHGGHIDLSPLVVKEITVVGSRCGPFKKAIDALQSGAVHVRPLIQERYLLEQGVQAVEQASVRGVLKVLLQISQ